MANLSNKKRLGNKDYLFIDIYLTNGQNGADAYRKAYDCDSIETSKRNAYQLLKNPSIIKELESRREEIKKTYDIKKEDIIKQLTDLIYNSNFLDYYTVETYKDIEAKMDYATGTMVEEEVTKTRYKLRDLDSLTLSQQRAIKQIKMTKYGPEIVLHDRQAAIDSLSKMLGFYEQTVNVDTRIDTSALNNLTFEQLEKLLNNDK